MADFVLILVKCEARHSIFQQKIKKQKQTQTPNSTQNITYQLYFNLDRGIQIHQNHGTNVINDGS